MYYALPPNYYIVMTVRMDYIANRIISEYAFNPSINSTRIVNDIIPLAVQYHIAKLSKNKYVLEAAINAIKNTELIGFLDSEIMEHILMIEQLIVNSGYINFKSIAHRYHNPDSFIFDFDYSDNAKVLYVYEYVKPILP